MNSKSNPLLGARVQVNSPGHYLRRKNCKLVGLKGTVCSVWSEGSIGVELDGVSNSGSKYGYFYFCRSDLDIIPETDFDNTEIWEEKEMKNCENYLNVARIRFVDGPTERTYEYANYEPALEVGDLCVVMSAHHGLGLAYVEEIQDRTDLQTCREIVAIVHTGGYDTRVECRKRQAELKVKMQERAKKLQDVALYQMLAKEDPEMAGLLRAYQGLPHL